MADDQTGKTPEPSLGWSRDAPSPSTYEGEPVRAFPERVGRFRLVRKIAEGGMGAVFEAIQDKPQRVVAVKLMKRQYSAATAERFERESQMLAEVRHPGIAHVIEAGVHEADGVSTPYFAMEYVPGARPISKYVDDQVPTMSVNGVLRLFVKVCDAVEAIHRAGFVHRDLKPGNVLVGSDGEPKVVDFGIARRPGLVGEPTYEAPSGDQILGTPIFMAPEQCAGDTHAIDQRADVYSLGLLLFDLLTKQMPYPIIGLPLPEAMAMIRFLLPNSARRLRPEISADLDRVIAKTLAKNPAERYASAGELASELRRVLEGRPVEAGAGGPLQRGVHRMAMLCGGRAWRWAITCTLIGFVLGAVVGVPLTERWTPAGSRLASAIQKTVAVPGWSMARIVAITEETPVAEICREIGLDIPEDAPITALRALHGAVFRRLAEAGPRVVAIDIAFRQPSPYDEGLITGVRALRARGIPVVQVVPSWAMTPGATPELVPELSELVVVGGATWGATADNAWQLHAAVQSPLSPPRLSFAMLAVVQALAPGSIPEVSIDAERGRLTIRPSQVLEAQSAWKLWAGEPIELNIVTGPAGPRTVVLGLQPGVDQIAYLTTPMPPSEAIDAATVDYADALRMSAADLRRQVQGKVVLIVNLPAEPVAPWVDGRSLPLALTHAAAIDGALRSLGWSDMNPFWMRVLALFVAGMGAIAAWCTRSNLWLATALLLLTGACLSGAWAMQHASVSWRPLGPIIGAWLAAAVFVSGGRFLGLSRGRS